MVVLIPSDAVLKFKIRMTYGIECFFFILSFFGVGVVLFFLSPFCCLKWSPPPPLLSGSSSPLREHPSASWDTGHRGLWSHLAHAAAGHRPLSDRLHQDTKTCFQQWGEKTQVTPQGQMRDQ